VQSNGKVEVKKLFLDIILAAQDFRFSQRCCSRIKSCMKWYCVPCYFLIFHRNTVPSSSVFSSPKK